VLRVWYQISYKKKVGEVYIHEDELDPYLRTSDAGMAHVVPMHAADAANFFRDSPCTLGDKKGSATATVLVTGRWRGYRVNNRTYVPLMGCSNMKEDVAKMTHSHFESEFHPWLSAMQLCEEKELPARQVQKTTLVRA